MRAGKAQLRGGDPNPVALYAVEARIRDQGLTGEAKQAIRLTEAKPVVERFFAWVNKFMASCRAVR